MNQDYAPAVLCECLPCTHQNKALPPAPHGYDAKLVHAIESNCADKLQSGACVRCAPVQSPADDDYEFHQQVDKDAALRHYAEQVQHAQDQKDAARLPIVMVALERIATYPKTRADELSATSMRAIACAAIDAAMSAGKK
jgi:hypothetical protein